MLKHINTVGQLGMGILLSPVILLYGMLVLVCEIGTPREQRSLLRHGAA